MPQTSGMIFSGAAARQAGAFGGGAANVSLDTFHHRRVSPPGRVKIMFQSKGFSLVVTAYTGRLLGVPGAQGAKSWARMPTARQPSGTGRATVSGCSQPAR